MYSSIKTFFQNLYIKYIIREKRNKKEVFYTSPRTKYSPPSPTKRVTFTATRYFKDYKIDSSKEKRIIINNIVGNLEFAQEENILIFVENHRMKKVLTIEVIIENAKKVKSTINEERKLFLRDLHKPIGFQ
jgi:hypothetical protein